MNLWSLVTSTTRVRLKIDVQNPVGSWFLVCSNIFLLNDNLDKREWTYVFGACCLVTICIPSFRNYRLYSFFGVIAITYTSWYMTVAALVYGQVINPAHQFHFFFVIVDLIKLGLIMHPLWSFSLLFSSRNVLFFFRSWPKYISLSKYDSVWPGYDVHLWYSLNGLSVIFWIECRRREQPMMGPILWCSISPAPPTSSTPSAAMLSPCKWNHLPFTCISKTLIRVLQLDWSRTFCILFQGDYARDV